MSIAALVVDDEPLARRAIVRLLSGERDFRVAGECGDGLSAVAAIRAQAPDVVFLDIQMPEMTGLEVLDAIAPERMPVVVFVTAYEQHAVRAFEANAVDYLVKPFGHRRFTETVARVRTRLASGQGSGAAESARILQALEALRRRGEYAERIAVRVDEHVAFVDVGDIVWIQASRNTVQLHLAGRSHELRETMTALAARLDPRRFARIHRSAIVNVARVRAIHPWFKGHHLVVMENGQQLRMSRYQHEAFVRLVSPGPQA